MKIDKRRRPYLDGNEYELFEQCSKREDSKELELKQSYQKTIDIDTHYFNTSDLSVQSLCEWLSNEAFPCIANEGVIWLMHFISLGARTAEVGEKVEFVELELRAIVEYHCMENMKDRINPESYALMEKDLKKATEFYGISV